MPTWLKLTLALIALPAIGAGAWWGQSVPFAEQWPMFEALRTTAAIIFAVVGAWMAIIYPDRMKLSFRERGASKVSPAASSGWEQLFTPVIHSTAILAVILLLGAAVPILRHHPPPVDVHCLRGTSYGLLVLMTLWQLWTVVLTLIPADTIKSNLDRDKAQRRATDSFLSSADRRS